MKIRLILAICMTMCFLAACGDTEIPTETDYNQTMVNIGQDMKENAQGTMDIVNNASYSSFEEVYNDYSGRLASSYKESAKQLKEEIKNGDDMNALTDSCAEKVKQLDAIAKEGTETISGMASVNPGWEEDYSPYIQKLNNESMAYGTGLNNMIMKK